MINCVLKILYFVFKTDAPWRVHFGELAADPSVFPFWDDSNTCVFNIKMMILC